MAVTLNPSSISTNEVGATANKSYFYFDIVFSVISASNGTATIQYNLWWKAKGDDVDSETQADPYNLKFSITNNGNRKVNLSENPWYSSAVKTNETKGISLKSGTFTLDKNSKSFSFNFSSYIYSPISGTCTASGTVAVEGLVTAKCTIKYNLNGGTGTISDLIIESGKSGTISKTKPTRTGYDFQGWSTKKNGSVNYKGGDEYKFNGTTDKTTTLYAVWKIKKYEVTIDFNGGHRNSDGAKSYTQLVEYGKDVVLPDKSTFSYKGYTFNKWQGDYTGVISKRTITAIWNIIKYKITYKANGVKFSEQEKEYGKDLTLLTKKPAGKTYKVTFNANGGTINSQSTKTVKLTQTFLNWKGSDGKTYKSGAVYKGNDNLTLTAQFENPKLETLPTPVYTFENSTKHATFTDWYTKKSGGTKVTENTVVTKDDTTYWARYNYEIWYTLSLIDYTDKNNEPHFMQVSSQTKYYDKDLTLADITPYVKNGEEVKKWNTKSNGSGDSYKSKAVYTKNAPLHLYGITGKQEFTVTFEDGYGNKIKTAKITAGENVSKTDLKDAENKAKASIKKLGKLNKKFAGWIGDYTKVYSNRTVIACWDASAVWIVEKTSAGLAWTPYLPDKKIID